MKAIFIKNVLKSFQHREILKNINLTIKDGDFHSIVGPSGTGKTTLLNIISGILKSDSGDVDFFPSHESWDPLIQVFQNYMLFPDINIFQNISYGFNSKYHRLRLFPYCKNRKEMKEAVVEHTLETLRHFGLEGLEKKYPAQLSSGQQQRAAIARAVIIKPKLLLLDEPFANLDQNLKMETAEFLKKVQQEYKLTTVAVTHDLNEAFAISDTISIMLDGEIKQSGGAQEVYQNPVNEIVGEFLGPVNVLTQEIISCCRLSSDQEIITSEDGKLLIRAEFIEAIPAESGPAIVTGRRFHGKLTQIDMDICGTRIRSLMLSSSLTIGEHAEILIQNNSETNRSKKNKEKLI